MMRSKPDPRDPMTQKLVPNHLKPNQSDNPAQPVYLPSLNDYLAKQSATTEPLPDLPCPKCQSTLANRSPKSTGSSCQRKQWIAHVPDYLVLYVQRSDWLNLGTSSSGFGMMNPWSARVGQSGLSAATPIPSQVTQIGTKRSEHMSFPAQLDVANYLLSSKLTNSDQSIRFNVSGDNRSDCFKSDQERPGCHSKPQQSRPYILRSVLVHQGRYLQSGHYVTYRYWPLDRTAASTTISRASRLVSTICTYISNYFNGIPTRSTKPISSDWLLTSDSHILRVPIEEVHSSMAYLLFYERLPDPDSTYSSCSQSFGLDNSCVTNTDFSFVPKLANRSSDQALLINHLADDVDVSSPKHAKADLIRYYMSTAVS